jgi:hypothetical protein
MWDVIPWHLTETCCLHHKDRNFSTLSLKVHCHKPENLPSNQCQNLVSGNLLLVISTFITLQSLGRMEEWRNSSTHSEAWLYLEASGQLHTMATLLLKKHTWYPLNGRPSVPWSHLDSLEKNLLPCRKINYDSSVVQHEWLVTTQSTLPLLPNLWWDHRSIMARHIM